MKILAAILLLGGALGAPSQPGQPWAPGTPGNPWAPGPAGTPGELGTPNNPITTTNSEAAIEEHNDLVENEERPETEYHARSFELELGASRGKLLDLNDEPPMGRVVIFMDSVATIEGKISNWEVYVTGPCKFCFAVFHRKKTEDGATYYVEFGGENCVEIDDTMPGVKDIEIPPGMKLAVTSSSMVAIVYPSETSPRCIKMESDLKPRKVDVDLGRIMVVNPSDLPSDQVDHFIQPGTYIKEKVLKKSDGVSEYKGTPSFKAIVTGPTKILSLNYGPNQYEGLAMIFFNDNWGTICDHWWHSLGWPMLFCDEKGYPTTGAVSYNVRKIPPHIPINVMNPRCKASLNQTMFQCHSREDQHCDHNEDLYIKCKRPVELRGDIYGEGFCFMYESNYWGSICDTRGTEIVGINHWANVCCREAGFKMGALSMEKVISTTSTQYPISMHSPDCISTTGTVFNTMKSCHDGPISNHCTHADDMYIYCDTSKGKNEI